MEIAALLVGYWAIGRLMILGIKASNERDELKRKLDNQCSNES